MTIDLTSLNRDNKEEIDITNNYEITSDYFINSNIKSIKKLNLKGKIYKRPSESIDEEINYISAKVEANLILEDSISLEPVDYEISFEYDDIIEESWKKDENTLDIFQFLWENIVLEVPLHFTKVQDLSKFHGDGWKLISEDELRNSNNPFSDLLKDLKKE